jgi:hypothetical protein
MKKLIATAAVAFTAITAQPAMAWGEREQGIVTGIIGTIILQDIYNRNPNNNRYPQQQQPVIIQQTPALIIDQTYNQNSVQRCGFQENIFRDGNRTIVEKRNSCTGQLLERREHWR